MFGAPKRGRFRSLATLILVVNVVGELQRKRTLAASRGFLAAARLSCWHIHAHENILSPACLTVFVKSNQHITFVIAYLVADNNVKCETVAATRDRRLHYSRPRLPNSADLNTVDCSNVFIGNLLKTERWWSEVASDWSVVWHPAKYRWSGNWRMASSL